MSPHRQRSQSLAQICQPAISVSAADIYHEDEDHDDEDVDDYHEDVDDDVKM